MFVKYLPANYLHTMCEWNVKFEAMFRSTFKLFYNKIYECGKMIIK